MPTVNRPKRPWLNKPATVAPKQQGRQNPNRDVYNTERWKQASIRHRTANPLCVSCLEVNVLTDCSPGNRKGVTDHINPINMGGDPWDSSNWQTLCNNCHKAKNLTERWPDKLKSK